MGKSFKPPLVAPDPQTKHWQKEVSRALERLHDESQGWTTSNVVTTKDLDANSTTLAEVADVLCTLIELLKTKGIIED